MTEIKTGDDSICNQKLLKLVTIFEDFDKLWAEVRIQQYQPNSKAIIIIIITIIVIIAIIIAIIISIIITGGTDPTNQPNSSSSSCLCPFISGILTCTQSTSGVFAFSLLKCQLVNMSFFSSKTRLH